MNAGNTNRVVIPDILLRRGDEVFLDGIRPMDIESATGIRIAVVGSGAEGVLKAAGLAPKGGTK